MLWLDLLPVALDDLVLLLEHVVEAALLVLLVFLVILIFLIILVVMLDLLEFLGRGTDVDLVTVGQEGLLLRAKVQHLLD